MKGFGDEKKSKKKILNEFQIKQYQNQIMLRAFKYHSEGNISEAKKYYQYLIKEGFKDERVFNNYGMILLNSGDLRQARIFISKVIELNPKDDVAYSNLGGILKELGELDEAALNLRKAIELDPKNSLPYCNLGGVLNDLGKFEEAEITIRKAIELNPNSAESHCNLGGILKELRRSKEAIQSLNKAIELNPNSSEPYTLLGIISEDLGNWDDALNFYKKAISLNNKSSVAKALLIKCKGVICDWSNQDNENKWLDHIGIEGASLEPLGFFYYQDDPIKQLQRSKNLFEKRFSKKSIDILPRKNKRIRLGYFSADFRAHPVMHLFSSILKSHDKSKFEIYLYSFAPKEDKYTEIAKTSGCIFKDIKCLTDLEVVELARKDNIDIAIDLMGYTKYHRMNIFSYRVAPIQISFLGFPGTTGSNCIDYIIADNIVIPTESEKFYTEKIIRMPNSYLCNDYEKIISQDKISRKEFNLPEKGFVFTSFCANKKITEKEFDVWMRLLKKIKGSVIWLSKSNQFSAENLIKEAAKRNIDPKRIIFASKLPSLKQHLARYSLGDLGLDTFNYNGHATTSDALWSGLPVITKTGKSFAARVSASLITTLGLTDLITHSTEEYEEKALYFASNTEKLVSLRSKLVKLRETSVLYNSKLFTKTLEDKFREVYLK